MQTPDSPAPAELDLFYDVDERGNLVRRSLDVRTSSTASRSTRGTGEFLCEYDRGGRLERVSEILWSAGGGRV